MVRNGAIIQTHTSGVVTHLDETPEEILSFTINRLRNIFNSDAKEIVAPFSVDFPDSEVTVNIPKSGNIKKLLELSQKNVLHYYETEKIKNDFS